MSSIVRRFTMLALLCLVPGLLFGQVTAGTIAGTVKDQSGAVVTNATVTATNTATKLTRTVTSSASGNYILNGLPVGRYDLNATAPGMTAAKEQVDVTVGSRNGMDLTLGVAASSTTVEVVGEGGATVNTLDQQQSTIVTTQQITQLPTVTRNPYDLVATASNVQQDSQAGMGDARGAGFTINGQRSASTDILLDGAENVDQFSATVGQQVPLDSVQEFRVVTNGMTAEYGRASGGVVNVATKSGTNAWHGSAYEFNRISALSSNTYDNVANNVPKPRFDRNQFGYSVGGPIVHDKLFFFNSTEFVRVRSQAPQITNVLDPAFLAMTAPTTQAFFSQFGKLRPDLTPIGTLSAGDVAGSGLFGTGGPGPLFSAIAPGTPVFDTVQYRTPSDAGGGNPENTYMTVGRIDFNISDKTQLFGRYALYNENDFAGVVNTSPYSGFETGQNQKNQNFELSLTHTFGPTFLSNTRLVWQRLNFVQPLGAAPVGPTLYMNSGRAIRVNGKLIAFPGYNEYTPGGAIPFGGPQNLGQFYEDLSWSHGNHTFRFGGQYIRTQDNRTFGAYEEAVEGLSSADSATSLEHLLAGDLATFQGAVNPQGAFPCVLDLSTGTRTRTPGCTVTTPLSPPQFSRSNLYNDFALYGQDTWKVTSRLTLDLGVRWEYYGVQHNRNPNLDSNFYYGSGGSVFDQIRNGQVFTAPSSPIGSLWKPRYGNVGPRVGFAYDLFGDGKTSLRGGYGIGYERNFNNVTFNVIQNPPNYAVLSLSPRDVGGVLPIATTNSGPLAGSGISVPLPATSLRNVFQNIPTAYAEQYNLQIERQLGNNTVVDLGYNGSHGIHLYDISNTNEPGYGNLYLGDMTAFPSRLNLQYGNINNRNAGASSHYNSLVAALRGRIRSAQIQASYTWSHSIDDLSSTFSDEVQNNSLGYLDPFNPNLDRASSDFDARHRVSVSMLVPIGNWDKSDNKFVKNVLGGFEFAPIFTFHSGYPFTVFDCTNSGSFVGNCPRADLGGPVHSMGATGSDTGGNLFDYLAVPANVGEYAGPMVIPGTTTPFPDAGSWSNLPTCTGLFHTGCSFPSNMLGRNSFNAPSVWNWDMGVYKNFKITERVALQLRGEFFNILNHKNFYVLGFGQGGGDVSSLPTCGAPGGTSTLSTSMLAPTCNGMGAGVPVVQAKKGGFGTPLDDHRNTQLAIKVTF